MNKNVFIVVILLGFLNTLSAQPQLKDSAEAYNYWAQRGIIEMVYAYMNDYIETIGEAKAESEIVGRDKYEENYISKIDNKELASFDTISSFLKKNNWSGTEKKLFNPLVRNYENKAELDSNFFSAKKPGSNDLITAIPGNVNKNINWNQKAKTIINEYKKILDSLSIKTIPEQSEKEVSQSENNHSQAEITYNANNSQRRTNSDSGVFQSIMKYYDIILYILIAFIIGFIVGREWYLIMVKRKISKVSNDEVHHEDSIVTRFKKLIRENNELKKNIKFRTTDDSVFVKSLKEENERLKRENYEFKQKESQLDNVTQKPDIESETINTHEWEIKQPKTATRKLFFSMPESDGRFIVNNGEPSNDGRKYFRIEYIEGSETGELYYISGDRDKRAINKLESYLKPVCDIENITSSESAKNIVFNKPGIVRLINDNWKIDPGKKVKIKLI